MAGETLPAGIDVRGHGGWIVAPGVMSPDGRSWQPRKGTLWIGDIHQGETLPELPEVFLEILRPRERSSGVRAASAPTDLKRGKAYSGAALDGSVAELLAAPKWERNSAATFCCS